MKEQTIGRMFEFRGPGVVRPPVLPVSGIFMYRVFRDCEMKTGRVERR